MKNTIEILDKFHIKYEIKDNKIYLYDTSLNLSNKNLVGTLDVSMIENLKELWCFNNKLIEIICNENLDFLNCSNNNLSEIDCNENLQYLDCSENRITKIVCNENLKYLYCIHNNLTKLICNDNLDKLVCFKNPILKINRFYFKYFRCDICIINDKYYYNNSEVTNITIKNNKKIMKTNNETILIIDNFSYNITNIYMFKSSKNNFYENHN